MELKPIRAYSLAWAAEPDLAFINLLLVNGNQVAVPVVGAAEFTAIACILATGKAALRDDGVIQTIGWIDSSVVLSPA